MNVIIFADIFLCMELHNIARIFIIKSHIKGRRMLANITLLPLTNLIIHC